MALTITLILSGGVLATFLGLNLFNFLKRMIAQNKANQMKHIHAARAKEGRENSKDKTTRQERRAARQAEREQRKAEREEKREQKKLHRGARRTQKAQEKEIAKQQRAAAKAEKQAQREAAKAERQADREARKQQRDLEKRTKYNTENIKHSLPNDEYTRNVINARVQEATALRSKGKNLTKEDKARLKQLEKEIDTFMKHNDLDPQPTILPQKEKKVKEQKVAETLVMENQGYAHETINQKAQRATELANKPFLTMADRQELATLQDQLTTFYEGNPTFENVQQNSAQQAAQSTQSAAQLETAPTAETETQKTESRARRFARGVKNKAGQILSADLGNDHHHDNTLHYSP